MDAERTALIKNGRPSTLLHSTAGIISIADRRRIELSARSIIKTITSAASHTSLITAFS
jgi:hypothetical protein